MDEDEWHQVLEEEEEEDKSSNSNIGNNKIDPKLLEKIRSQIKTENGQPRIHEEQEDDLKINLQEAFSVNLQKQIVMEDDDMEMEDADIVFNLPTSDTLRDDMAESDDSELQVNLEGHHEEGPVDPIDFATEADQFDDEEIMLNVDRDEDLIGPNWKVDPDYMFSQADFFTEGEPLPEDLALNFATAPTSVHLRLKAPVSQKTILTEYDLAEFTRKWPGRQEQIQLLVSSMGEPKDRVRPTFIYGDNATGKTSVIRDLFSFLHPPHVFINCLDCHSQRYLFESIIDQLNSWNPSPYNNFRSFIRCENLSTFLRVLKSDKICHFNETIYLIFDHAHKLAEMSPTLLAVLLKLNELVSAKNYAIILISNRTWDALRDNTFGIEPLILHFNQYSETDTLSIIRKDCPQDEDPDFYQNFASQLYQTFSSVCLNVQELRYLSGILFPKYLQPVLEGGLKRSETQKLHHKAKYLLGKEIVHRLYLRELSEQDLNAWDEKKVLQLSRKGNLEFTLPKTLKYLLLSAYLASHNPAKYDQRMFGLINVGSKQHGGMKKMKDKFRSPKSFSLERMLAIYQCITDQMLNFNSEISSQISTLVSIKLLSQVSAVGTLDSLKFRCPVTPEFIEAVALSVNFDLSRYLHDE